MNYTAWKMPSKEQIELEFQLEHENKGMNIWNSSEEFVAAVENAVVIEIDRATDSKIAYRSHTSNKNALITLIRGYRSYPQYRNEKTIENLYERFSNNEPMDMSIVLKDKDGNMRVLGGNTRMDVCNHLDINPHVLMVEVEKIAFY